MKIIIAITCLLLLVSGTTKAAFTEKETTVTTTEQSQFISQLSTVANLSRKEFEQLTGRKLSLVERIGLQIAQHRLKKDLKRYEATGTLPQKLFENYLSPDKGRSGRNVLLIVIIVLLLLLLIPLAFIGKWK